MALASLACARAGSNFRQPTADHSLVSDGAAAAAGAQADAAANPEVDAWHAAKKAQVEAECNDLMKKLWVEKRGKLNDVVLALRKEAEGLRENMQGALREMQREHTHVQREHGHLEAADKNVGLAHFQDAVAAQQAKVFAMENKIIRLEACSDELKQAEAQLAKANERLVEARYGHARAGQDLWHQRVKVGEEAVDVPPAKENVRKAESDVAEANARVARAKIALTDAHGDLTEHDDANLPPGFAKPTTPGPPTTTPSGSVQAPVGIAVLAVLAFIVF